MAADVLVHRFRIGQVGFLYHFDFPFLAHTFGGSGVFGPMRNNSIDTVTVNITLNTSHINASFGGSL
jgi:hypothetical protein